MGAIIALIVVAAIGASKQEGVFKKGYETTYQDTVAFEQHAQEQHKQYVREKAEKRELKEECKQQEKQQQPENEPGI